MAEVWVNRQTESKTAIGYLLFAIVLTGLLYVCYRNGLDTLAAGHDRVLRLIQLLGILLLSFLFLAYIHRSPLPSAARLHAKPIYLRSAIGICAFALLSAAFVALAVLQSNPLGGDQGAYVLQADFFAHGRLWGEVTKIYQYVSQSKLFPVGDKLVSQYPPGWPALLAASQAVGIPSVAINPIIGALTVIATFVFAERQYGGMVALFSAAILATSAFFIFNSASFYNGSIEALFGVLFVGAASSYIDNPNVRSAIATGFWFSAMATIRHFDAILFAAPVAFMVLRHGTVRHWKVVPFAILAAAPLFAALLVYYAKITGNPLLVPQTLHDPTDGLFGPNWHIARVTEILVGRLVELAEWVSPPFVIALAWALGTKLRNRKFRFFDVYGPLFLAGYWLYWADGGFRWGPRYILPALPFMALIVADTACKALEGPRTQRSAIFVHLVAISTIVALVQVPFLALRGRELITQTQDIYSQVRDASLHNAVVVAVSGTGTIWRLDVGDLPRNGLTLDKDVIYAHGPKFFTSENTPADIAKATQALHAYFPTRSVWLYTRDLNAVHGHLARAD